MILGIDFGYYSVKVIVLNKDKISVMGEKSIIDESTAALTLNQLDYTYEFNGNSVTIIQIASEVEQFNQTCDYVILDDIFTIIDTFTNVFNHLYEIKLSYFDSYFLLFIVQLVHSCPKYLNLKVSGPFGRHTEPLIVVHLR